MALPPNRTILELKLYLLLWEQSFTNVPQSYHTGIEIADLPPGKHPPVLPQSYHTGIEIVVEPIDGACKYQPPIVPYWN